MKHQKSVLLSLFSKANGVFHQNLAKNNYKKMKKYFSFALLILCALAFSQKKWSLQECVEYAVKNNLQVINNQYNASIQAKNAEIAKRDALPGVSGNINNNTSFGQARDVFGNVRRNDNFLNSASVGANIQLYNHGRIQKAAQKSQYDLEASLLDVETTKNNISLQIAQQYLQVLLNKEVKKIAEESLRNAEKVLKRAKATTDAGTTAKTVEAEAEAGFAREKQRVKSAEIDIQRALFNLAILLQLKDHQGFEVEDVPLPALLDAPLASVDQIVETAYQAQPQVKAAETRVLAAQKQIDVAKTVFYPTISANAGIGSSYFNSLTTGITGYNQATGQPLRENNFLKQYQDNFGQQAVLNISIPIFNKGISRLQVEQAKISESVAKNNSEIQKLEIKQNVQRAYFDANANYEIYLAALEAEKSAKLALDFAEKSYEAGRTTIYDLNIVRNNFVSVQGNVSQAKYNYVFSTKLLNFYAGLPLSL